MTSVRMRHAGWLSLAMFALMISTPALAEQGVRSVSPELVPLADLQASHSQLQVDVWANRSDGEYIPGEAMQLHVRTSEDAHVTILATDSRGRSTVIFPNAYTSDGRVTGNTVTPIPGPGAEWRLAISEPLGTNMIKVLATTSHVDPFRAATFGQNLGPFRARQDSPELIARSVTAVMNDERGSAWAMTDLFFDVVRSRQASAQAADFGLDLALDKASYRIGDTVSLRLKADRDCSLTVVNINESRGEAVVLYPNREVAEVMLYAGETMRLPGPGSVVQLEVLGPPGPQTMIALCTEDDFAMFRGGVESLNLLERSNMRAVYPVLTMDQWAEVDRTPRTARASVSYTVRR